MFELSIASKYLTPRWRQLSVSVISLISILVIALVVWLIVVFFSVTRGLEKSWTHKLIALTAPVRLTPTEEYFHSYYYMIDGISDSSNYSYKSIGEKISAPYSDPYNPEMDEELPHDFPKREFNSKGTLLDPVKEAFATLKNIVPEYASSEYVATNAQAKIRLNKFQDSQSTLTQMIYLGGIDPQNPLLADTVLPSKNDLSTQEMLESVANDPVSEKKGYAALLPKAFQDAGAQQGDSGYLSYQAPTGSTLQEQRVPFYVAGFYDPGIFPLGGKFFIASPKLVNHIRSSSMQEAVPFTNGINVRVDDLDQAEEIKNSIVADLKNKGIDRYWNVESYQEFAFAKDLIQQLKSEKNLYALIAIVILIVACSNIVSMLIILVNDKKLEIGILRSMGATSGSIAGIFGFCGMMMGAIGSTLGIAGAVLTLKYINELVYYLGYLQGHPLLNPLFYGKVLPNQLSNEAMGFVVMVTSVVSLVAGIVPAIKACLIKPGEILKAE